MLAANEEYAKIESRESAVSQLSYPPELDDLDDETFAATINESESDIDNQTIDENNEIIKKKSIIKTKSDRLRQERHKQLLVQEQRQQEEKKLIKQINKIKQLEKDLLQKETESKRKLSIKKQLLNLKLSRNPKKLSRYKYLFY